MQSDLHNPTLRVINTLNLVDSYRTGISMSEISSQLQIPKSTLSPILRTLVSCNFLNLNDNGEYTCSFNLFQLGLDYSGHLDVLSVIKKQMEVAVEKIGEIVQFGILDQDQVLYLEKVNTKENIEIVSSVGMKLPASATAIGKALLSGLSDAKLEAMYSNYVFKKFTENTITSFDRLLEEIHAVRKNGYAVENQEISMHTSCIAVPIKVDGCIKGAISATYPLFRYRQGKVEHIITILLDQKNIIEKIITVQGMDLNFTK
ncbi:IclR family transcriptional regulator [Peptoniphilus equinus]|uniref:IclR family transcriptional regulator n=1 Tax=Peptoniphilus equinus TaxID=3016343 RepID=A0ABY7QUA6_9FIRM|nr:IclR family transcriptional regulator [Peptoniphilus equinus]WBW49860.1 IclR family transcriptional regulator [Peptoniphilus equinus]